MKYYTIHIDGRPYQGEDPESTYSGGDCWSGSSWQTQKREINILRIGDGEEVKVIMGNRSLRSDLDKILRRVDDGLISFDKIVIDVIQVI